MKYNSTVTYCHSSIRLKGYDYSQAGMYFITICVQNRECMFRKITDGEMVLNEYGKMVEMIWNKLPQHYKNVELGEFVVTPNHIHGIIIIMDFVVKAGIVGVGFKPVPTMHGLSEIVRVLKTFSTRKINELFNQ